MIKIKYNDSETFYDVSFERTNDHVITLRGLFDIDTTGFTTWRMDGVTQLGDFSEYITVYRELEDGISYSNDESVYVEPEEVEIPEEFPMPEPIAPTITLEERISDLENALIEFYENKEE